MQRPIFFIVSAVLVLVLLIAWVYILFFSQTPTSDDPAFVNFPGSDSSSVVVSDPNISDTQPVIDLMSPDRLRQLTLEPVIGFKEVLTASGSSPKIYYVTAGRGHIFSIDLTTGEEVRVSGTTIASARYSEITPDGSYALTQSGRGAGSRFFVSALNTGAGNAPLAVIQEDIVSFKATIDNTFLYARKVGNGLEVKEYFPIERTSEALFTIPFQEAVIEWGVNAFDTHFIYPKASTQLEGYLYIGQSGEPLVRVMPSGFGFSAIGNLVYSLFSVQAQGFYQTFVYDQFDKSIEPLLISVIPQKCASLAQQNKMVCASEIDKHTIRTPDDWHEGTLSFADTLYEVDLETGILQVLVDTLVESGRALDIINPKMGREDATVYFQNKNDQTLWLFEKINE